MRRVVGALLIGAAGVVAARPVHAQSGAFVARLGNDTVAVERFVRRGNAVTGISVVRSPRTLVRRYELQLLPDGSPSFLKIEAAPPGGAILETTQWTWRGDSVIGAFRRDTVQRRWSVAVAGRPLPFSETLYGPWAIALKRAAGRSSFPMVYVRQVLRYTVQRHPNGSFTLHLADHDPEFDDVSARLGRGGELQVLDMTATTSRYLVRRVAQLDVEALAAEFARREMGGTGLGVLSPRDTVRAEVGGAHVSVDYSRPAVRGRTVFGGLLAPFGQVWRTGADAATQLATDRDVEIGGTAVPAGVYSVFSIPSAGGWTLILNRQHGQWGTEYHQDRDFARIPLKTRQLGIPVERFTIEILPANGGPAALRFAWANREGTVPIRPRAGAAGGGPAPKPQLR